MGTLIMIGQLILGLSIIVGLHEMGHLLTAKLFGMRVERFSIGFPPKIFGIKWGETEYSVGALPLGGYVKISGMIDESFDTEHLSEEPKPYEFRSKPAWQRLIVMMGGILVNVITGIMMFVALIYFWGESYIPASEVNRHGIVAYELAQEIGLQTGDKIIAINGRPLEKRREILSPSILLDSDSYYTVIRNGEEIRVDIPNNLVERLSENKDDNPQAFIDVRYPFKVGEVKEDSPADQAGLKEGDQIVAYNGQKIDYFHEFKELQDQSKNKTARILVKRNGKEQELRVKVSKEGTIGFFPKLDVNVKTIDYSLPEAIQKGTADAFGSVVNNIKGFGKIFRQEVSLKTLKGPIGIAEIFGSTWDWYKFWQIIAILSMWLAFLNFLPIPALDGGHVMFLVFEIVSGRKPSDRFLERAQYVGIALLLSLMVFVIFNDIFNVFLSKM